MVRAVLYIFLAIILISFLRAIAGVIGKAFSGLADPRSSPQPPATGGPRNAGELKRDPVCGTYVSTSTSIKKTVAGEVVHFCSAACCDKYRKT